MILWALRVSHTVLCVCVNTGGAYKKGEREREREMTPGEQALTGLGRGNIVNVDQTDPSEDLYITLKT